MDKRGRHDRAMKKIGKKWGEKEKKPSFGHNDPRGKTQPKKS